MLALESRFGILSAASRYPGYFKTIPPVQQLRPVDHWLTALPRKFDWPIALLVRLSNTISLQSRVFQHEGVQYLSPGSEEFDRCLRLSPTLNSDCNGWPFYLRNFKEIGSRRMDWLTPLGWTTLSQFSVLFSRFLDDRREG